jgi:hypothetical protein
MRYCYTEASKAEITLEMTVADLQELRAAVKAAAACENSTYRIRRLSTRDLAVLINPLLKAFAGLSRIICCVNWRVSAVMQIEITATATDEAPVQPLRDRAQFRLRVRAVDAGVGRLEEAAAAFEHLEQLIDTIDT